jgi:molybdate transport system regulatory protein
VSPVPDLRLRLVFGDGFAFGPGKAELLAGVARTGSISAAGRAMGMSYKRAWTLVETMNRCFAAPLVEASRGGSDHGGARLTDTGQAALAAYRRIEAGIEASPDLEALRALSAAAPAAATDMAKHK